jgi:ribosomal protein S18 acetylase RimI-like enzyme
VTIRTWKESDLPAIHGLLRELSGTIGEEYHEDFEAIRGHFREMEKKPDVYACFVYSAGSHVVGFVSLVFYRSVLHRRGTALINELVVAESQRGKGVGKELLVHCVELARQKGYDEIEVGVMRDNQKAVSFYKANGLDEEYVLLGMEFGEA